MESNSIYNILLFGESGAGKSTTINALANYLQYSSFEQADSGKFVKVIPSKITLIHPKTYKELVCQDAVSDPNEHHNDDGHSVTQSAKNYDFQFRGKTIRIIDTPGMGDTGGLEVDKQNFKNILEHLKTLETLHGICFLIKTNTTRKTAAFRFCLNQLMTHIPRHACANIVFCFTFSRNSLYGPGDGFATLKEHLRSGELGCERIELKGKENCFYIDNEAFRYLLAKKHGYPFTEDKKSQFLESWNKSSQQTTSMITRIVDNFEPFKIETIFRLSDYSKFVQELNGPISFLRDKIQNELESIEEQEKRSKRFNSDQSGSNAYQQNIINKKVLVKSYTEELDLIQDFIRKLIQFLVINLNTNCHNLIRPHLSLFSDDGETKQNLSTYQQYSPSPSKRSKISIDQTTASVPTSPASLAKINRIVDSIKRKNSNQVNLVNLKQSGQKLANLRYSGNQIGKILGIEPNSNSKVHEFSLGQEKTIKTRQTGDPKTKGVVIKKSPNQNQNQPTKTNPATRMTNVQNLLPMAEINVKIEYFDANSSTKISAQNSEKNSGPKSKSHFPKITSEYSGDSQLNNNINNFNSSQKSKSNLTDSTSIQSETNRSNRPITKQPVGNANVNLYDPNSNSKTNSNGHSNNANNRNTNPKSKNQSHNNPNARVAPGNIQNNNSNQNSNLQSNSNRRQTNLNYDYERQEPKPPRNCLDQMADCFRDCFTACC